jgi:hypothetical protein
MLWHRLRFLFSWLLLVVIPLQAFAAGAVPGCHPGKNAATPAIEAMAAAANAEVAPHAHHSVGHTSAAPHAVQSAHQLIDSVQTLDTTYIAQVADHQPHKCNACSPCCVSALPSVPVQVLASRILGFSPFPEPLNHQRSALPGGLERPPRPLPG